MAKRHQQTAFRKAWTIKPVPRVKPGKKGKGSYSRKKPPFY